MEEPTAALDATPSSTEPTTEPTPLTPAEGIAEVGLPLTPEQVANALPPADVAQAPDAPPLPSSPELAPEPFLADPAPHPVHAVLAEAEELCLIWGGELGTKLRNLICKARDLL